MRQEQKLKCIHRGKRERILKDGTIVCIENPNESTINLLRQIYEFSKDVRYKVNTLKSIVFILVINN